jgi:uncharacterized membrane protein YgdD (TMEM256/DUF423 family)
MRRKRKLSPIQNEVLFEVHSHSSHLLRVFQARLLWGMTFSPVKLRAAAVLGLTGVALGAFGAHWLESYWVQSLGAVAAAERVGWWDTGVFYQLIHAVVLLVLAFGCPEKHQARIASMCFVIGVNVFSGTLFLMAVTGMKWMGAVVPVGGMLLIVGWGLLARLAGSGRVGGVTAE